MLKKTQKTTDEKFLLQNEIIDLLQNEIIHNQMAMMDALILISKECKQGQYMEKEDRQTILNLYFRLERIKRIFGT